MQAPDLLRFVTCTFSCHTQKPVIPHTQRTSGQFSRSRPPEREADSSPPFDAEVSFSSNLIPLSVSVLCIGTGYSTLLRLKTCLVQDSINHSPHSRPRSTCMWYWSSSEQYSRSWICGGNRINFGSEHTGFSLWNLYPVFNFNSALRICLHERQNNQTDEIQEGGMMWIKLWKLYLY
jgi:hypothetical protein